MAHFATSHSVPYPRQVITVDDSGKVTVNLRTGSAYREDVTPHRLRVNWRLDLASGVRIQSPEARHDVERDLADRACT